MTTYTGEAYKTVRFSYRLRKAHYYDILASGVESGSSVTIDNTFTAYSGLNASYSQVDGSVPFIATESGTLPNYTTATAVEGCMATMGSNNYYLLTPYYNNFGFGSGGSPTINQTTGDVTSFAQNKFLRIEKQFDTGGNTWEIKLSVRTPSSFSSTRFLIGGESDFYSQGFAMQTNSSKKFGAGLSSNGTSWDIGWITSTTTLKVNTWYQIKLIFDGEKYSLYLSTDNVNYNLEASITSSATVYCKSGDCIQLGNTKTQSNAWAGQIGLADCYIKVNGATWWTPVGGVPVERMGLLASGVTDDGSAQTWNLFYKDRLVLDTVATKSGYMWCGSLNVPAHTVYPSYKKNFTVVGSLTSVGYTVKGFGANNYLVIPQSFDFSGKTWEMVIKVNTSSDVTTEQYFLSMGVPNSGGILRGIRMCINDSKFNVGLSYDGTNLSESFIGTTTLSKYTEYTFKVAFTGSAYYFYINNTLEGMISSSSSISPCSLNYIGIWYNNGFSLPLIGSIDLRGCYIEVNDDVVWKALE